MSAHRIPEDMAKANFPAATQIMRSNAGYHFGFGTTKGGGIEDWAPGAMYIDDDASQGAQVFVNTGTKTTAVWTEIADAGVAGGFVVTSGTVDFGVDDTGVDVRFYGATSGALATWDESADAFVFEQCDIVMKDGDLIAFGDKAGANADFSMKWDGTNFECLPDVDDTGAFHIGDGTTDMDFKVFIGASGYFEINLGDGQINIEQAELHMGDSDEIEFGDGDDVIVQWDGTNLVTSAAINAMWDNCPTRLDPNFMNKAHFQEEDFIEGNSLDDTAVIGKWIFNVTGTGTTVLQDNASAANGVVVLTCQSTTDDAAETMNALWSPYFLAAGKDLWFECRFKLEGSVTAADIQIGLISNAEDMSDVADNLAADGVLIHVDTGSAKLKITASKGGTNTGENTDIGTLILSAWTTVGFFINGVTSITPYVDGVADTAITATFPDDTSLGFHIGVRNGDGTTQEILHVDYMKAVQLR